MKKTLVYKIVSNPEVILYPPLGDNSSCDFISFTNIKKLTSKHWDVRFDENICSHMAEVTKSPENFIPGYDEYIFVEDNQIVCGSFEKFKDNLITVPTIESLLPEDIPVIEPSPMQEFIPNPTYTDGPYDGYPLQLSICLPISNRKETLHKCLDGLKPLLDNLDSELIVVDTSTDGSREIAESYGAKIIPYTWRNDFAEARNLAIREAQGSWVFSIDDDEWFENVDEIVKFFGNKQCKTCDVAYYTIRNYNDLEGKSYSDFHAQRMAKNHPRLHYIDVIHECFDFSFLTHKPYAKYFSDFAHHYGYAYANDDARENKLYRNISGLYTAIKASPLDLRLYLQLCTEITALRQFETAVAFCLKLLSLCKLKSFIDPIDALYWKRIALIFLYISAQIINDKSLFQKVYDLTVFEELNCFQHASVNYFLLSHAFNNYEYEKVCVHAEEYYSLRKEYLAAPSKPTLSISITVDVVEPVLRYNTVLILHAFSLMKLEKQEDCANILSKIDFSIVDDNDKNFLGQIFYWIPEKIFVKHFPKIDDKVISALYAYAKKLYDNSLTQPSGLMSLETGDFKDLSKKVLKSNCFTDNPDIRMIHLYGNPSDLSTYDWFCEKTLRLEKALEDICLPAALNGYNLANFLSKLKLEGIQTVIRTLASGSRKEFVQIFDNYLSAPSKIDNYNNFSIEEIYLFTGFLESHLLNINDEEYGDIADDYLKYFTCYIKLLNMWTTFNYNPKMFELENFSLLPATSRGGVYLYKALENTADKNTCIEYIKSAVSECPVFDRGAKLLLKEIIESSSSATVKVAEATPTEKAKTEFELLGDQLKSTAKQLVGSGKFSEAKNILIQLSSLMPEDLEVKTLLDSCKASNLLN